MAPLRVQLWVAGVLLLLPAVEARAQCSIDPQEQFTVNVSPSPIGFSTPTATHFNAGSPGYINGPTVTLSFTTNTARAWKICLRYPLTTLNLGNGKALSDLLWSADGSTWTAVTTTEQVIHTGTGKGSFTRTLYLRALLRWPSDTPYTYGASLVFTGSH